MASETIANGTDTILHKLDLNDYGLSNVPDNQRDKAKQDIADYLKNEVIRSVTKGTSPVEGEGRFKILDPDYARHNKGGVMTANLQLEGDLLDSFFTRPSQGPFIEVGHTGSQVPKADGHNQLSSKAKTWAQEMGFPKRRYIPDDNQKYSKKITSEIESIISEYVPIEGTEFRDIEADSVIETTEQVTITASNLFDDDAITALFEDAQRRSRGF